MNIIRFIITFKCDFALFLHEYQYTVVKLIEKFWEYNLQDINFQGELNGNIFSKKIFSETLEYLST